MLRLTELMEALRDRGLELEQLDYNPRVVVRWWTEEGPVEREIELVLVNVEDFVVLHCPIQPPIE